MRGRQPRDPLSALTACLPWEGRGVKAGPEYAQPNRTHPGGQEGPGYSGKRGLDGPHQRRFLSLSEFSGSGAHPRLRSSTGLGAAGLRWREQGAGTRACPTVTRPDLAGHLEAAFRTASTKNNHKKVQWGLVFKGATFQEMLEPLTLPTPTQCWQVRTT